MLIPKYPTDDGKLLTKHLEAGARANLLHETPCADWTLITTINIK